MSRVEVPSLSQMAESRLPAYTWLGTVSEEKLKQKVSCVDNNVGHILCCKGWPEEMDCDEISVTCKCKGGDNSPGRCLDHTNKPPEFIKVQYLED